MVVVSSINVTVGLVLLSLEVVDLVGCLTQNLNRPINFTTRCANSPSGLEGIRPVGTEWLKTHARSPIEKDNFAGKNLDYLLAV